MKRPFPYVSSAIVLIACAMTSGCASTKAQGESARWSRKSDAEVQREADRKAIQLGKKPQAVVYTRE